MNEQTLPLGSTIPSDVRLFLAAVRRELADLGPDEVTEMTDGLEADLTDLVTERGPEALGDPKAYAAELRAAAGIVPEGKVPHTRRPVGESVTACLDACHAWFDQQVDRLRGDPQPILDWLRPTWWIVRAWVAVCLLGLFLGAGLRGGLAPWGGGIGWPVSLVAIALSVLIGVGRVWPGGARGLFPRVVLLGLNCFAIVMTLPVFVWAADSGYDGEAWDEAYQQGITDASQPTAHAAGLVLDGKAVANVYPFDAEGRPIAGVQLFDQDGHPLIASGEPSCPKGTEVENQVSDAGAWDGEKPVCFDPSAGANVPGTVFYPWTNGQAQLKNVFPLASRQQEDLQPSATAFQEDDAPTLGDWPFATVPKVSLPGIVAGIVHALTGDEATKAPSASTTPSKAPKPAPTD